jgi:hypothetical protein
MGATMGWPAMALLGFLVLIGVVVVLGTSSTARYEFEHNGARERQRAAAPASRSHPAGSRQRRRSAAARTGRSQQPQAVDLAVRPAPPVTPGGTGWWLVDDCSEVLAGPFADQVDADWAALSGGLPAVSMHGTRRTDGTVAQRPSPEQRAWLDELGAQLDRLPHEWNALLSDEDPLTTLVVEVTAALVEAGLPLHDAPGAHPAGGVVLLPELASGGVVVSWRTHDRMGLHQTRGAAAHATVQQSMSTVIGDVLWNLGFVVEPFGEAGSTLVTAIR